MLLNDRRIRHFFHLVDKSPWPFLTSLSVLGVFSSAVAYMHFYKNGGTLLLISFITLLTVVIFWWRDVIREGTFQGKHTKEVVAGLRLGMILFIISEVLFFFAFFWAFFHCSLDPAVEIGCVWPPPGIKPVDAIGYSALFGTGLLLLSGCVVTVSHYYLRDVRGSLFKTEANEAYLFSVLYLFYTICLGTAFTLFQFIEYRYTFFNISDSIYGSTFFMTTGFHGFHVIIGTIFLSVQLVRLYLLHYGGSHHVGYECAVWYWHFVDVVWIFVYSCIYLWGGGIEENTLVNSIQI